MFRYASGIETSTAVYTLQLSRASSIVMLIAYVAYIFFQLKTHRELFDSQEVIKNKKRVYIGEQCFRLQMTQLI